MAKLYYHGLDSHTEKYKSVGLGVIAKVLKPLKVIALDLETNVVDSIIERDLKVISFSSVDGEVTCVIDVDFVREEVIHRLMLAISKRYCIVHNFDFEYQMFKKYGVTLEKGWCTMIAEQNLTNGYSKVAGAMGLKAVLLDRVGLDISKAEQLTFAERPYTDNQVAYAAMDTVKLGQVYTQQRQEMINIDAEIAQKGNKGIKKANWWDFEFVKVAGDMSMYGLMVDNDKWYAIADTVQPVYDKELSTMNEYLVDEFKQYLTEMDYIASTDRFVGNLWTSSARKVTLLSTTYPELFKTSIVALKEYLRDFDPDFPEELTKALNGKKWVAHKYPLDFTGDFAILKVLILRNFATLEILDPILNKFALDNWRDLLIENEWLIPANKLVFNWASQKQRLGLFQYINPEIPSTGKEVLVDFEGSHPIISHYLAWSETEYQLKMFGKNFYDKGVDIDGLMRTRFNIVLQTGRLGSVKPNLLNIPRKEVYRDCVIPHEGNILIGADYDAEELIVTATLAQETSWLMYLEKGYDIHSMNASLIYGGDWLAAAEDDCQFYAKDEVTGTSKFHKCSCPKHKEMRNNSKAVSFGSVYGISKYKLAFNLKISEDEAEYILTKFFEVVPHVRIMMDKFAAYGLANGHIIEPVFGRVRFIDKWKLSVKEEHGAISRLCFNTPIQSAGSALLKIAMVLMRRYIIHNNYVGKIWLVLPYHDEVIVESLPEYVDTAKAMVEKYMKLAAKLGKFNINAEAESGYSWSSIH